MPRPSMVVLYWPQSFSIVSQRRLEVRLRDGEGEGGYGVIGHGFFSVS
jgi:hypothetical protein